MNRFNRITLQEHLSSYSTKTNTKRTFLRKLDEKWKLKIAENWCKMNSTTSCPYQLLLLISQSVVTKIQKIQQVWSFGRSERDSQKKVKRIDSRKWLMNYFFMNQIKIRPGFLPGLLNWMIDEIKWKYKINHPSCKSIRFCHSNSNSAHVVKFCWKKMKTIHPQFLIWELRFRPKQQSETSRFQFQLLI